MKIWFSFALGALALLCVGSVRPQGSMGSALHMSTQERLETEAWWPTQSNTPLDEFAGSETCAGCHQDLSTLPASSMRRAAVLTAHSSLLKGKPAVTLRSAPFSYALAWRGRGLELSVSDGSHTLSQGMDWEFGAGDLARTFLYQKDNRWYQSEASFYTREGMLDTTTGLGRASGGSRADALGQPLSGDDARSCFTCHNVHAVSSAGLNPARAEAGIGCEACHGPGRKHSEVMRVKGTAGEGTIFNPAKLSPVASIDFCGACHRTFADATLTTGPGADLAAVRFQPYRLEKSRCWLATRDERLTCVACHDPHQALERGAASYDRGCLRCHSASPAHAQGPTGEAATVKVCPKATSQCVTCHMPKVAIASMHGEFTDHWIRVVKPGEGLSH